MDEAFSIAPRVTLAASATPLASGESAVGTAIKLSVMPADLHRLEQLLGSPSKDVRLKALKLILSHPDVSPLQIVRGLCSADNRDFEFKEVFGLSSAMRGGWEKLRGVDDDEVFSYLESLYRAGAAANRDHVVHMLHLIGTPRTADLLTTIRDTTPDGQRFWVDRALSELARPTNNEGG